MVRTLNLDGMFISFVMPEIEFEMIHFNGGEWHIKLNNNIDYSCISKVIITNRFKSGDDIMKVLIAKDALERKGVKEFELVMPYIPYARQDRQQVEGESFTLKVFADIINSAKFSKVYVVDSHSDVAPALINKSQNVSNERFITEITSDEGIWKNLLLVSPDSGANKKTNLLYKNLTFFKGIVKCDKKRDVKTGDLSGFEVFAHNLNQMSCLIVDDICSRGGTFMGIAKALKEKNAGNIYLFVTHYEGVADEAKLKESGISRVYKTNSMNDYESDFVKNIKIQL